MHEDIEKVDTDEALESDNEKKEKRAGRKINKKANAEQKK